MPFIVIPNAASGPVKFRYFISTPESTSSETIDPSLPTILFIHGLFLALEIFTFQFKDPKLRRFNLIAIDLRGHGETEGPIPSNYGCEMAAEDLVLIMGALSLPACHIFGLSLGSTIALHLAITYPQKVLSLFLLSPLGLDEPANVLNGRIELYESWAECFRQASTKGQVDPEVFEFALQGGMDAFKDWHRDIVKELIQVCVAQLTHQWNAENLNEFKIATFNIFNQREAIEDALTTIRVPVILGHGMADVAYTLEHTQKFFDVLQDANVNATLETIPDAAHFGTYESADRVNLLLNDFIESLTDGELPPAVEQAKSPWDDTLRLAEHDDDSDDFLIVKP